MSSALELDTLIVMKIAIIVRRLNVRGGTQRQALELARELKKLGHHIKLYTFLFSANDCFPELLEGVEVVSLNYYPRYSNYFLNYFFENRASHKLAKLIDKDTEILNPHDQVSYRAAVYFKKNIKNISSIWMSNDLPTKMFSFWKQNQLDPSFSASLAKKILWRLIDCYEIKKFIGPQNAITVLDNMNQGYMQKFIGKEATVVRSGLDLGEFNFVKRIPPHNKSAKILLIGIFFLHRRFEDAILAQKILRDEGYNIELNIIGDYSSDKKYHQQLVRIVEENNLTKSANLLGKVSDEELRKQYLVNDIFVFPNHMQTWGLVVMEAMASGLPVIVSKTTGASEVLNDGENSLLVSPKLPNEIAASVKRLINDSSLYIKLSQNGRKFVEENISWEKYTKAMLKAFEDARAAYRS